MFAVVEEEVRQHVRDLVEVAEADKPRERGMHVAVASTSRRADLHEKAVVGKAAPNVSRTQLAEVHPIPADRIGVKVGNRQFVEDAVVRRLCALVADHALDRLTRAMVVSLAVSAIRSFEHVGTDKDRTNRPLRPRHFDDDHGLAINIDGIDGFVEEDVRADLVRGVHRVPEIGHDLLRVRQPLDLALTVLLANAKNDDAAVRVGERAVRRPEVGGNAAPCPLELDGGVLALGNKSLYLFVDQLRCSLLRHSGSVHGVQSIFNLQSHIGDHLYIRIAKEFASTKQAMPEVRLDHYFCRERFSP